MCTFPTPCWCHTCPKPNDYNNSLISDAHVLPLTSPDCFNNLYRELRSLVLLSWTLLSQNFTHLYLYNTDNGVLPRSPSTAAFEVLYDTERIYLQNFPCTSSIDSRYWVPQISDPYNNIGETSLSNKSRDKEIGKPPILLMTRFSVNTALSAWADNVWSGTDQNQNH